MDGVHVNNKNSSHTCIFRLHDDNDDDDDADDDDDDDVDFRQILLFTTFHHNRNAMT